MELDPFGRLNLDDEAIRVAGIARPAAEEHVRRLAKLDDQLRRRARHRLAAAEIEGHALPSPIVHQQLHRGERRRLALRPHARFRGSRGIGRGGCRWRRLPPAWPHGAEHLDLLVAHGVGLEAHGSLHRGQREELEQMALEHVAEHARLVVVAGAMADGERFGGGDLARDRRSCGSTPARKSCWRTATPRRSAPSLCPGSGRCGRPGSRRRPCGGSD